MGKPKNERRVADNEARAFSKYIDSSPYKLNLVAELIRGKKAEKALIDLDFSNKRVAREVKKVLQSAVANAENNHNMDKNKLYVAECFVCPGPIMKRIMPRAQGRAYRILKRTSHVTVVLKEKE